GEADDRVAAQRVADRADPGRVGDRAKMAIGRDDGDGGFDDLAAVGMAPLAPRLGRCERRVGPDVADAAAGAVGRAPGVAVVGRSYDVAVARELLGEEHRLDTAATETVRE